MSALHQGPEEGFLAYLQNERRLAGHTLSNYARDLRHLLALVKDQALAQLTVHDIRRFIATLHSRGLSGRSLARHLSTWRGFFDYLARDHGFQNNPCIGLRAPKSPKRLPAALTPEEAAKLVALDEGDGLAKRDRAILELFYSSGLRLAELVNLNVDSLQKADATLTVTGKGSKTRVVPVGKFALRAIEDWYTVRSQWTAPDQPALFVNKRGQRISPRTIQSRLKQWGIKQGVQSKVHPHVLRHSFASHVLQSSGDLRAVQEMMGHASIASTQIYTHLDFQHLAKIYDAAHPRAKKR